MLPDWGSIAGIEDWEEIEPDRHHDWIGKRDEAFRSLYPMGSKEAKGREDRRAHLQTVQQRLQDRSRRICLQFFRRGMRRKRPKHGGQLCRCVGGIGKYATGVDRESGVTT